MTSRFADKLGSNYCPTDDEALDIKALISETNPQLTLLDTQIAALENSLAVLRAERQRVSGFIDAHQALLSPIRRLPDDLIREICVACCIPTERNCVLSSSEAPILLGRVCSSWRAISLATPQLWARLYLPEPIFQGVLRVSDKRRFEQRIEGARQWLSRSGQCPLAITFVGCNRHVAPATRDFTSTRLVELLMEFSARWQDIDFTVQTPALRKLATLQALDVPLLRSFHLSHYYEDLGELTQAWDAIRLLNAPHLTRFSANADMSLGILPLRWQRLTHLALEVSLTAVHSRLSSSGLLDILRRCPHLEFGKLVLYDEETPAQIQELPPVYVDLNALHTLELACVSALPWSFTQLLARLSAPRLRNFAIAGHFRYTIQPMDSTPYIERFFSRTLQLENFQILLDSSVRGSNLEALLTCIPTTVRTLLIRDSTDIMFAPGPLFNQWLTSSALTDDVFALFICGPTSCPALERIVVQRCLHLSGATVRRCCEDPSIAERFPSLRLVRVDFDRENPESSEDPPIGESDIEVQINYRDRSLPLVSPWLGLLPTEKDVDPGKMEFGWMKDWQF